MRDVRDLVAVIKSVFILSNCWDSVPFILLTRQIITVTAVTNPQVTVALKLRWCHIQTNMGPAEPLPQSLAWRGRRGAAPQLQAYPHGALLALQLQKQVLLPQQSGKTLPQEDMQESLLLPFLSYHSSC